MADHQFEQKVSHQLADFKLKPSVEAWQQVEKQLEEDRRRRRWFFYLPIAALLIGALLYAVWPDEESAKTGALVQTNTTNSTTNTTVEKNTNGSSLTKTGSSTTVSETTVTEKEVAENNLQQQTKTTARAQLNNTSQQQGSSKTKAENKHVPAVTRHQQTNRDEVIVVTEKTTVQKDAIVGSSGEATKTEQKTADSWIAEQPDENKTDSSLITVATAVTVVDTNSITTTVPSVPVTKKKWQLGLHANIGLSDIRGSLFPGSGFKSFSDATPSGINNGGGPGGPTRIVQYEYAIKPSSHMGVAALLRKPFKKRHAFVTGLQYQISSYAVTQRQRIDSFFYQTNTFSNVSTKEKTEQFRMHTLSVPLKLEFKIADIKKGALLFNAGVHNWFVLSSIQTDTLSSFRYAAESYRSGAYTGSRAAKETKATIYQPQLYLSPAYEWRGKKTSSQLGLYLDYGLRPAYKASSKDYWWQTGIRYRIFFQPKK